VTRGRAIALAAALVVLLAAALGIRWFLRSRAASAAEVGRASLVRCVLGDPLGAGESASARVHRIVMGNPPGDWPARCDDLLKTLENSLYSSGQKQDADELRAHWGSGFELEKMFAEPWTLDALFAAAPAHEAPNDVVKAPAPLEVADERTPALPLGATLQSISSDAMPGASLHVVLATGIYCAFSDALDGAECSELTKRTHAAFQAFNLWPPTEDGAESLVSDQLSRFGRVQRFFGAKSGTFFDAGGPARALWAFGYADGKLVTLGPSDEPGRDGYDLLLWHGKEHDEPYRVDLSARRVFLLGDRILWVAHPLDTDRLMWAALTRDPLGLGKPTDLGDLPFDPTDVEACRTEKELAVALVRGAAARVLFFSDDGASKPLTAKLPSDTRVAFRARGCGKDDLTITRVVGRARQKSATDVTGFIVQHARCTHDGCKTTELDLDKVLANDPDAARPEGANEKEVVAGGLGEKLFIAWISRSAGIRARLATPDAIATAKDLVVYDDGVSRGKVAHPGTVHEMAFLPRRGGGVLLLSLVGDRVAALRVGLDAKITPVAPQ
jgi:hypothetical protein